MIQLTRIAPENTFKQLRSQINKAMDEVEGDQPMLGSANRVEINYWGPEANGSGLRIVAHSDPDTVTGMLLVQCLPDNTDAVITDVNGEIWTTTRPTLESGITKLQYTWVTISILSVRLPTRVLTIFKSLSEYGLLAPNVQYAPNMPPNNPGELVFPLGLKALFKPASNADLVWSAAYLAARKDRTRLILHVGPLIVDPE